MKDQESLRPELSRFDWKPVSMLRANLSFCINLTLGASFILTFMVMVFDFFFKDKGDGEYRVTKRN